MDRESDDLLIAAAVFILDCGIAVALAVIELLATVLWSSQSFASRQFVKDRSPSFVIAG